MRYGVGEMEKEEEEDTSDDIVTAQLKRATILSLNVNVKKLAGGSFLCIRKSEVFFHVRAI